MRDGLAERLLATVMDWSPADIARERPILQALALLKYDEYQQFSPGMRFVESLALWLRQFQNSKERQVAYDFVKSRLVFLSEAEMSHFAAVMYPDIIRPLLLDRAAGLDALPTHRMRKVLASATFQRLQASTLFFGMSDGARIDQFRRSNRELSHEQIFASYEIPPERVAKLAGAVEKQNLLSPAPAVVLLDDFAGSGTSCVRWENGDLDGKLTKFVMRAHDDDTWKRLVQFPQTTVIVAFYVATTQALAHMRKEAAELTKRVRAEITFFQVQLLDDAVRLQRGGKDAILPLVERYYDDSKGDEHTEKGGTDDLKYGYAACGLPLILHHNTPNNSLYLLWAEESLKVRPLFERFSRHRREQ